MDDEINNGIEILMQLGYNRKESTELYFASNKDKIFDPKVFYNKYGAASLSADSEDIFPSLGKDQRMPHIVPSFVKRTDSDEEYGSVISSEVGIFVSILLFI